MNSENDSLIRILARTPINYLLEVGILEDYKTGGNPASDNENYYNYLIPYLRKRVYRIFSSLTLMIDFNNPNFETFLRNAMLSFLDILSSFKEDSISSEELTFSILKVFEELFFSKDKINVNMPIYLYGQMIRIFKSNMKEMDLSSEKVRFYSNHLLAIESLRERQDNIGVIARMVYDSSCLELNQLEEFLIGEDWQGNEDDSYHRILIPPNLKKKTYGRIH